MAKAYGLTEKDVLLLRDMAAWYKNRIGNRARVLHPEYDALPGPDGEIILAPTGGIPALVPGPPNVAGSAECSVLDVIEGDLVESSASPITVYNVGLDEIPEGSYALARRTRRGLWIVDLSVGSDSVITYDSDPCSSNLTLSGTPTAVTGMSVTIPSAGNYLFIIQIGWRVTAIGGAGGERIYVRLNDTTNSAFVGGNTPLFGKVIAALERGTVTVHFPALLSGTFPATVICEAWHDGFSGGTNTADVSTGSGGTDVGSRLTALKLD